MDWIDLVHMCLGIGTIFLHYNAIILLNYHYKYSETLSVAMGFALCGQPVAIMSTPLILYWLQRQVGWVGASVISGTLNSIHSKINNDTINLKCRIFQGFSFRVFHVSHKILCVTYCLINIAHQDLDHYAQTVTINLTKFVIYYTTIIPVTPEFYD